MTDPRPTVPLEALLAHAEWLGALARSLIRDPDRADDVVQETWVAAIQHPPREKSAIRAWLATVARNAARATWRSERRRERREQSIARREAEVDRSGLAERLEQGRQLVELVRSLDEPYRSTILMRFFDGITPREIATRCGVPGSTVRNRLRRALGQLRAKLDERTGGDRRAWTLALAPLLAGPPAVRHVAAVTAPGATLTGLKASLIAVGLGALLVVTLRIAVSPLLPDVASPEPHATRGREAGTVSRPGEVGSVRATVPDAERGSPACRSGTRMTAGPGRTGEAVSAGVRRPSSASRIAPPGDAPIGGPPAGDGVITGTVTVPDGDLPAEALLRLAASGEGGGDENRTWEVRPDPEGRWRFEGLAPGPYRLVATHPRFAPHALSIELGEEAGSGPYAIALKRGGAIVARVVDVYGAPLRDETVVVTSEAMTHEGRTDADGRVRVEPLEAGSYRVRWKTAGSRGVVRYATAIPGRDVEVLFEAGGALTGTVAGPDGTMLEGAIVRLAPADLRAEGYRAHEARTDADGGYRITGIPEGSYDLTVQVLGRPAYTVEVGRQQVWTAQTERHAILIEPTTLAGQVTQREDGSPLDRTRVQITATPLRAGETGAVERGKPLMAFADEEGRFRLIGIAPGRYELWFAPFVETLREDRRVVEVFPGGAPHLIEVALETRRLGRLRLRVLEPDGSPATGVRFFRIQRARGSASSTTLLARDLGRGVFEIALEEGEQTVSVQRQGFRAESLEVWIVDGAVSESTVRLEPGSDRLRAR